MWAISLLGSSVLMLGGCCSIRLDIVGILLHLALGGVSSQSCSSQRHPQRQPTPPFSHWPAPWTCCTFAEQWQGCTCRDGEEQSGLCSPQRQVQPCSAIKPTPCIQSACLFDVGGAQCLNCCTSRRQTCPEVLQVRESAAAKAATTQACLHPASPDLALLVLQVREAVAVLDLEVLYRPCPANGPTWRAKVREMGGKASFPFMHDPNTGGPADCSPSNQGMPVRGWVGRLPFLSCVTLTQVGPRTVPSATAATQSVLPCAVVSWLQSSRLGPTAEQWVRQQAGRHSSQAAQAHRPTGML